MEKSIKGSIQNGRKDFKLSDFYKIRKNIILDLLSPEFSPVKGSKIKNGHKVSFKVKNYPMPLINLWEGRLDNQQSSKKLDEINVSFEGPAGPIVVRGDYDPSSQTLGVEIPKTAKGRNLVFLVPVSEYIGPDDNPVLKETFRDRFEACEHDSHYNRVFTYPVIQTEEKTIKCEACKTNSLCPYGAIKFDVYDVCFVDLEICRGIDRMENITCFECFVGEEQYSEKCPKKKLGRTLQVDHCCGCCAEEFLTTPGICLVELCEWGGVGGGHECERCPGQVDGATSNYTVNEMLCNGCRVCFDNNSCRRLAMKAYIRHNVGYNPVIHIVRLKLAIYNRPSGEAVREVIEELESHFGVTPKGNGGPPPPPFLIPWDKNYNAAINQEFNVGNELDFYLFFKNGKGHEIPMDFFGVSSLRSTNHKIKLHEGVRSGVKRIGLGFGSLEIHYQVKPIEKLGRVSTES